jgi:3'(2'), 5'-bisphosphate nucleotidase
VSERASEPAAPRERASEPAAPRERASEPAASLVSPADHVLAAALADETGRMLIALREDLLARGVHPYLLRDEGDQRAHELIVAKLRQERPDDFVLSEEGYADPARVRARRVWIVDPLDGTREYGIPGDRDWAVHIALCVDGWPVAAAVSLPAHGLVFATDPPPPPPPARAEERPLRIAVSRSRPQNAAVWVAQELGAELVPIGSAGAKAMAVVLGECDAYLHHGGQYEWDSCAPVGVASAAGLHTSRIDGSPLVYNRPDPWLPDLMICRAELADPLLEILIG